METVDVLEDLYAMQEKIFTKISGMSLQGVRSFLDPKKPLINDTVAGLVEFLAPSGLKVLDLYSGPGIVPRALKALEVVHEAHLLDQDRRNFGVINNQFAVPLPFVACRFPSSSSSTISGFESPIVTCVNTGLGLPRNLQDNGQFPSHQRRAHLIASPQLEAVLTGLGDHPRRLFLADWHEAATQVSILYNIEDSLRRVSGWSIVRVHELPTSKGFMTELRRE